MIYLDSSVALAQLLTEENRPGQAFWRQPITSSRLTEYEIWNRLNRRRLGNMLGDQVRLALGRWVLVEMTPDVLSRAVEPFPIPVRTLDALHLATMEYLRAQGEELEVATYDVRLADAAKRLKFTVCDL